MSELLAVVFGVSFLAFLLVLLLLVKNNSGYPVPQYLPNRPVPAISSIPAVSQVSPNSSMFDPFLLPSFFATRLRTSGSSSDSLTLLDILKAVEKISRDLPDKFESQQKVQEIIDELKKRNL